MRALLVVVLLAAPALAHADDTHLHAKMDKGLVVMSIDNETTQHVEMATLTRERAGQLVQWLAKQGIGAAPLPTVVAPTIPTPQKDQGCGFGSFLEGKC